MKTIRYETNIGENCVLEIEDGLVEKCLKAELETAKLEFKKLGLNFVIKETVDSDGHICTTICDPTGNRFVRWIRM